MVSTKTKKSRSHSHLCVTQSERLERRTLLSAVTFATPTSYGTGNSLGVVIADLNGDGKPDIVAPESGSGTSVDVLLGDGAGGFGTPVNYSCSSESLGASQPYEVAVADVNNDGHMDIVTANFGGTMSVLLGNGDGTFGAATVYQAGSEPNGIVVGDFNGDSLPDIAVANRGDNTVGVYLNSGGGKFAPAVTYGTGQAPDSVGAADFNGNGHLDLFTANTAGNNVSVLMGNGDGTFAAAANYSVPGGPNDAVAADFNNDGKLDIATADISTGSVSLILNTGDGTFGAATASPAVSTGAVSITTADLNGDGNADVAVVAFSTNAAAILTGNGDGTFAAATAITPGVPGGYVGSGDINGDGLPDLVFGSYGGGAQFNTLVNTTTAAAPAIFTQGFSNHTIGEFSTSGAAINAALVTNLPGSYPGGLAVSGSDLFVSDFYSGVIGEYTTAGATVNANLLTGLNSGGTGPFGLAVLGSQLFVAMGDGGSAGTSGTVAEYTLGSTPGTIASSNPTLITGLADPGALAISGSDLYVVDYANGTVGKYTTAGVPINAALISGLDHPEDVAVSGSNLFVPQQGNAQEIGEYTTSGAVVNAALITVPGPLDIVVSGSDIFTTANSSLQEYTTSGTLISASLAPTFGQPFTLAISGAGSVVTPPPPPTPVKSIGALDPTFASNGLASHTVGFTSTAGVAVQPDGKSVIAGTVGTSPTREFGLTRYNADGSLDTTFGTGGTIFESFNQTDDVPTALKILPDGEILVAGTATSFSSGAAVGSVFAVARFTSAGVLDTGFASGAGGAVVDFSAAGASATSVLTTITVSKTGIIYLGGSTNADGSGTQFAVAALTAAGVTDGGFGTGGKVVEDSAGGEDVINSLALQNNGDVVAAGSATVGGVSQIALARFLPTGVLDKHFGIKGLVTTKVRGVYDSAASVVLTSKGQILVGGLSATGSGTTLSSDFVLVQYTTAGRVDRTFGGGPVITTFGQPSAITQLILQSNGDVIASGKTTASLTSVDTTQLDVAIARFTPRGVPDKAFNQTGKIILNLGTGASTASQLSVSSIGELKIAAVIEPLDASSLGAEFAAFTGSEQGVVAVTAGGELLDVGNSGANTVEAAIVTAGADLAATLIAKLPAAALEGAKETLTVKVSENGTQIATGTITIQLFASTDGTIGTGLTPFASMAEKVNLRQSQAKSFKLRYSLPGSAGEFFVVANVVSTALGELNANNNFAATTVAVNVAAPFVSLSGSGLTYKTPVAGKTAALSLIISNAGNIVARSIPVEVFASPDGTVASGTAISQTTLGLNLAAGATRKYRLSVRIPKTLAAGTYVLVLDFSETVLAGAVPFTVG